jgi:peptidyl-prolyl cis-trans isomerase C
MSVMKIKWSTLALMVSISVTAQAQNLVSGYGVSVDASEIRQQIERTPGNTKEQMTKSDAVRALVSNIHVRRVLAADALKSGIDQNPLVKDAIEKARERILSDAMLESIDQKNQPTLQDIEAYARTTYNANQDKYGEPAQVRASHILIRSGETNAREKLLEIHAQIKKGADFAEMAKSRSQDPGSAIKGGDLGYFSRGRMIKPFEDVVFAMNNKGQMSEVFESPFGFHIIQLTDKKPAGVKMFSEVKDQLMREAQNAIVMQGRVKERERILQGSKFDEGNFQALEKSLGAKP